jgi:hypothetical protein
MASPKSDSGGGGAGAPELKVEMLAAGNEVACYFSRMWSYTPEGEMKDFLARKYRSDGGCPCC